MTARGSDKLFRPDRLLAFSDAVFGVAITLLVIDMRLPSNLTENSDPVLLQAFLGMGPSLFVFVFTFMIVGMSWLGHHRKFSPVEKVDARLLWMNLLYLMALCLVPFASNVLSEHSGSRVAFVLYAVVMTLVSLLSAGVRIRVAGAVPGEISRPAGSCPSGHGSLAPFGWRDLRHWGWNGSRRIAESRALGFADDRACHGHPWFPRT